MATYRLKRKTYGMVGQAVDGIMDFKKDVRNAILPGSGTIADAPRQLAKGVQKAGEGIMKDLTD